MKANLIDLSDLVITSVWVSLRTWWFGIWFYVLLTACVTGAVVRKALSLYPPDKSAEIGRTWGCLPSSSIYSVTQFQKTVVWTNEVASWNSGKFSLAWRVFTVQWADGFTGLDYQTNNNHSPFIAFTSICLTQIIHIHCSFYNSILC